MPKKWSLLTCKISNPHYVLSMTIFVATLATILLVTKLGAKPGRQPTRIKVKAKKDSR